MFIERNESEIVIRFSSDMSKSALKSIVDYLQYLEIASRSKAKQKDVDKLAREVKKSWWTKNKKRLTR
ncbi:MAG TPA: hypothetical protein VJY62_16670 [Bacteroidia bacterium]|nr:hypothetical protein [Bacteroidia bacterium]